MGTSGTTGSDPDTSELEQLLAELAVTLLKRGITPKGFTQLARDAFVNAAANTARFRTGRINYSRVAALTGLPRAEVKRRLLSRTSKASQAYQSNRMPAERVIHGWLTDRRYLTAAGKPKPLSIEDRADSFKRLVRAYAGDVSHRAVLDELVRTKAATRIGTQLRLGRTLMKRSKQTDALSRIMPTLIDTLRMASKESPTAPLGSSLYRLRLAAGSAADLVLVRERCLSSVRSLLYGLRESLKKQLTVPIKAVSSKHTLTVTVLLAESTAHGLRHARENRTQRRQIRRPVRGRETGQ
jgi:hypothetical protein